MSAIEQKISNKIKESGLCLDFICKTTGIKEIDLSLSMNGKRKLKTEEFVSLCVFLGLNLSDFNLKFPILNANTDFYCQSQNT